MGQKKVWTTEEIRELVSYAARFSVQKACERFQIRHIPQFYYFKKRLENLESESIQTKRGRKPGPKPKTAVKRRGRPPKSTPTNPRISKLGPETVAKRRGRPPKSNPTAQGSLTLQGLLDAVISSLEELTTKLRRMQSPDKRSTRQKAK